MKRKILVTLLAFCLIASLCVVGAAATDDTKTDADVASITSGGTTNYYTASEIASAIASAEDGAVVTILKDFEINFNGVTGNGYFNITKDIEINGGDYTITATGTNSGDKLHVFNTVNAEVEIANLIIDGNKIAKHGIQIYGGSATITNVTSMNNVGYGLLVNGSKVTANNLDTLDNGWGGVNVNARTGGNASFEMASGTLSDQYSVVLDSASNSTNDVTLSGGTYNTVMVNGPDDKGDRSAGTDNITITGGNYVGVSAYGVESGSQDSIFITGATIGTVANYESSNGTVSVVNAKVSAVNGDVVVVNGGGVADTAPDGVVAVIGGQQFDDLASAVKAANEGDVIYLVADITDANVGKPEDNTHGEQTTLIIKEDITIDGNGHKMTLTVPADDDSTRNQVFSVGPATNNPATLTLNGVNLTINGKSEGGDAFDVWKGSILNINNSTVTLKGITSGFTMQGGESAYVNINGSLINGEIPHGNFSNGGSWEIEDSTLNISNCASHGLSVETAVIDNSTIQVNGAGYCGIVGREISVINGSNVSVTASGKKLPQKSIYAPNGETYNYAVELKKNGELTVEDAILTLSGNVNAKGAAIDNIFVSQGTTTDTANGTVNAGFAVVEGSDQLVVRMMDGNVQYSNQTVTKGDSVYLPTLSKSGYTFTGWRVNNSNTIVRGGESYKITAETTFTAVWNMIMIPDTYDIAVDQPAHGTVDVSFSNASQGSVITVTATPDEGYELVYITVDGEPISGNSFVMPDHAVEVSALFAEIGKEVNFVDVSRADWFYDYVQYVAQNGLMEGTTRTAFEPNASMTRAMFWTVLARIDGETITGDAWKTLAQTWAVESGISDGTNADALITREQMVTMLYRYAGSPVTGGMAISEFTDGASVSDYATDAVTWALSEGILTGMGDGILAPQGTATRAQAAAMLMRFVEA